MWPKALGSWLRRSDVCRVCRQEIASDMVLASIRTAALALSLVLAGCAGSRTGSSSSLKGAPDSAILMAADTTREAGHYAEAMEIYQRLLLSSPSLPAARYGAGECELALGHPENSVPLFDALVANAEFHARALQGKGLAQFALGQRDAAGRSLREATASDPSLWRAWNGLGDLADQGRQPGVAAGLYAKALALNPNSAIILNNMGFSLLSSGKYPQAIGEFRKALAFEPNNLTVQTNLRLALAASGDYAAALRSAPSEQMPDLLNDVGYIALRRGDYAAAERYLADAVDAGGSQSAVAARNLAWLKDRRKPPE
jgi:Flp pilus assembly protein TadD